MGHDMSSYFLYLTPLGRITLATDGQALTHLFFGPQKMDLPYRATELTTRAAQEVLEYLAGKRSSFDIPLNPQGTPFQKSIWEQLQAIPYGETRSYKDIAQAIGKPKAYRAVGNANNKNPLPIFIPCHRVIGSKGNLVGYAYGVRIKEYLLTLEAEHKEDFLV